MLSARPVFERRLLHGAVLVDPVARPGRLRLDGTAAALWRVVVTAGAIDRAELVAVLADAHHTSAAAIADDVHAAVDRLVAAGALGDD